MHGTIDLTYDGSAVRATARFLARWRAIANDSQRDSTNGRTVIAVDDYETLEQASCKILATGEDTVILSSYCPFRTVINDDDSVVLMMARLVRDPQEHENAIIMDSMDGNMDALCSQLLDDDNDAAYVHIGTLATRDGYDFNDEESGADSDDVQLMVSLIHNGR